MRTGNKIKKQDQALDQEQTRVHDQVQEQEAQEQNRVDDQVDDDDQVEEVSGSGPEPIKAMRLGEMGETAQTAQSSMRVSSS